MLPRLKISSYAKVIFTFVFILILLSVISIILSVINTLNIIRTSDLKNLEIIKSNVEVFLDSRVKEAVLLSSVLSNNTDTVSEEVFEQYLKNNTGFYSFTLVDTGKYDSISPIISPIQVMDDGTYGLSITVPVFIGGTDTLSGILVGRIRYDYIRDTFITSNLVNSNSTAFIVSRSGELLFSHDRNYTGTSFRDLTDESLALNYNLETFSNMASGLSGSGFFKSKFHNTPKYSGLNRMIYKIICYKPLEFNNQFLFSIAVTTPLEEIGFFIYSLLLQGILIVIIGVLVLLTVKRIHGKSLRQEVDKARVMAELAVANDIISKDQTILEQNERIEFQNKKIRQQKTLVDKLYKDALEQNKNRTEFFSNIAHELKTPVSVIISTVQLMGLKGSRTETQNINKSDFTRCLNIIKQNSLRIVKLINSLLQITKMEAGFKELNLQNTDIIKVTREICFSVSEYLNQKNIIFEFKSNIDNKVIAVDTDKIERIMLNLLSNAVKFTSPGGKITVNINADKQNVTIKVSDTGSGIPKEKLDTIFERFGQARTAGNKHHEGVGIGLSLVKMLVELHDGKIDVQSQLGKGTEFIVSLPAYTVAEVETEKNPACLNSGRILESVDIEFSEIYPLN